MGRTREALFSMLEARGMEWEGALVLDLFAGSGSLAFECLSRGAKEAWLVENSREAFARIAQNARSLGVENLCRCVRMDVAKFLRQSAGFSFNIVFLDPPYRRGEADKSLRALAAGGFLAPGAFVAAEIEKNARLVVPEALVPETDRLFGQTWLRIWTTA